MKHVSILIVISGAFLIGLIKFIIRPLVVLNSQFQLIIDVAPNFIGSMLIPFAAYWWFKKYFVSENHFQVAVTCWIGLLLVVLNEFLQLISIFGRTFDYLDIVFSFVGVGLGYFAFIFFQQKVLSKTFS